MSTPRPRWALAACSLFVFCGASCAVVLGFDDGIAQPATSTVTGSAGAGVGGDGHAGGGPAGGGGTGGTGGGAAACAPLSTAPCYTGPPGTEGVGVCTSGTKACNAEGTGYGPCEGEVLPAIENCAAVPDEDCDSVAPACTGTHEWSKHFGDGANQRSWSVAFDPNGNVLVTGEFFGAIDFGGGTFTAGAEQHAFVEKLSPGGGHVWSKELAAPGAYGQSIASDATGNVYLTGPFLGTVDIAGNQFTSAGLDDVFLVKFDPSGAHVWSKRLGSAAQEAAAVLAVDPAGNVVVALPMFDGTIDFGGGPLTTAGGNDVVLAKYDTSGTHVWSERFGDASDQAALAVAVDATGAILATGWFSGSLDFGGGPLTSAGETDVFVAKLDASGNVVWRKRFGDVLTQQAYSIAADPAGNVLIAGIMYGSVDFGGGPLTSAGGQDGFIAKFDVSGNHAWSKRFGDAGDCFGQSVAVDASGNLVLSGPFQGTIDLGGGPLTSVAADDVFVAKYDGAGNHLWSKRFGGSDTEFYSAVAAHADGSVALTTVLSSTVDFGGGAMTSNGAGDVLIARYAP